MLGHEIEDAITCISHFLGGGLRRHHDVCPDAIIRITVFCFHHRTRTSVVSQENSLNTQDVSS